MIIIHKHDMEALMAEIFSTLITGIISNLSNVGIEAWKEDKQFKTTRRILRERLSREMRYNAEIISIIELDENEIFEALELSALRELMFQPLPLDELFPLKLRRELWKNVSSHKVKLKHRNFIKNITSEAELIERLWHRYSLAKFKLTKELSSDLEYINSIIYLLHLNLTNVEMDN